MKCNILASACLAGKECRYDGTSNKMVFDDSRDDVLLFCPEVEGGLPTPREPAEIMGGDGYDVLAGRAKVVSKTGKDVTRQYVNGAVTAVLLCKKNDIRLAVLKSKSPSCGCQKIYNGTFSGDLIDGCGVTAALLSYFGIKVIDENAERSLYEEN